MIRAKLTAAIPIGVVLSVAVLVSTVAAPARAANDPMGVLKAGLDQVITVFNDQTMPLAQRREKLRSMSLHYFDFQSMAKSALGYHWRALTPAQREEFVPLFSAFIQDAYLSQMEQATVEKIRQGLKTARVNFVKQNYFGPDYAQVFSTVALRNEQDSLAVNYLLHRQDGQWRVYDVTIDAISLIANYRNQFNRVINHDGYPKLIADLQAKRQQLQQYMDQEASNLAAH